MSVARPALIAFAVYLAGSLLLGEVFPFSRFSMYADLDHRERGAVPIFLADGQPAEPADFASFQGLDPARFSAPEGVACSMEYLVRERADWVKGHPADAPGPIRITVGFDQLSLVDGQLVHDVLITAEGTAWR